MGNELKDLGHAFVASEPLMYSVASLYRSSPTPTEFTMLKKGLAMPCRVGNIRDVYSIPRLNLFSLDHPPGARSVAPQLLYHISRFVASSTFKENHLLGKCIQMALKDIFQWRSNDV